MDFHNLKNIIFRLVWVITVVLNFSVCLAFSAEKSITDATGTVLEFSHPPARVVSLNPDFTDILFALGLKDRLAGVTVSCRLPEGNSEIERVGTLFQPDLETIVSLRPDLVLATMEGNNPRTVAALRRLDCAVFVAPPQRSVEEYFQLLHNLGAVFRKEEAVLGLIAEFQKTVEDLHRRGEGTEKVTVFIQLGHRPLVTASGGTLINELVEIAGGVNICRGMEGRYPVISREEVIRKDPAVIIITGMDKANSPPKSFWGQYETLRAVKKKRVRRIDPDFICHLGPKLTDGLKEMARILHPEWFLKR